MCPSFSMPMHPMLAFLSCTKVIHTALHAWTSLELPNPGVDGMEGFIL